MGRKIEWARSLDNALTLNYVLKVDDRNTTIEFSNAALQEAIQKQGDQKAKQGLIEDMKRVVANPRKGLDVYEQNEILSQLSTLLRTMS